MLTREQTLAAIDARIERVRREGPDPQGWAMAARLIAPAPEDVDEIDETEAEIDEWEAEAQYRYEQGWRYP